MTVAGSVDSASKKKIKNRFFDGTLGLENYDTDQRYLFVAGDVKMGCLSLVHIVPSSMYS